MKKIEAIIRPKKLEDVIVAVEKLGVEGMNITQIAGYGKQKGAQKVYRGVEYEVKLKEKLKVELVVEKEDVEEITEAIVETTRTGEVGDGKIFVYEIEDAIRVRTGEDGTEAV